MPRPHHLLAGAVYLCTSIVIPVASICESATGYRLANLYPPGYTPATSVDLPPALDLKYFHPHHWDLPPGCAKKTFPTAMKGIPTTPPLPNLPSAQDFSKLGVVYITVLGPAGHVVPRTESWGPLATAANHLVRITLIVYMAFQAQPPPLLEPSWTWVWAVTPGAQLCQPSTLPLEQTLHQGGE
ncbi:hypothetical protein DSO57_1010053 [Entomophthora muscae]|uniref:Uncharacterized protein n=1 Tax=Entomophthora muscae TaxID=34485 RepID=A0ACC2TUG6_9FUNG|nr:hypothetical protein DSO57_1010053 [Entomophthora muscae]